MNLATSENLSFVDVFSIDILEITRLIKRTFSWYFLHHFTLSNNNYLRKSNKIGFIAIKSKCFVNC